jgi:hypothetical protein
MYFADIFVTSHELLRLFQTTPQGCTHLRVRRATRSNVGWRGYAVFACPGDEWVRLIAEARVIVAGFEARTWLGQERA